MTGDGSGGTGPDGVDRRSRWRPRFGKRLLVRRAGEREALLLSVLCMADMATTLWWVVTGVASEANPVLAWTFESHPAVFVLVKGATCVPALMLAPRLAQRHRRFTVWLLRGIALLYVVLYFGLAKF